jgi:hypothetical protein
VVQGLQRADVSMHQRSFEQLLLQLIVSVEQSKRAKTVEAWWKVGP